MLIEFRRDDGSLIGPEGLDLGALQAGESSAPLRLDLSYRWGESGDGDKLEDLFFRLATEDPLRPGVGVAKGIAPQDQLWARARFIGQDNTADPAQEPYLTDWQPLGAYRVLPFPSLHAGCSRWLELIFDVPGSGLGSHTFLPSADYSEHSRALAAPVPSGIEKGLGDRSRSRSRSGLIRGGQVSASASPDDQILIAAHQVLDRGELRGHAEAALTLDRVDGAADPLADGYVYLARAVATAAGAVLRKGVKAADPVAPSREAGDLATLEVIRVEAPPGGASPVITSEDLTEGPGYDRHVIEAGTGLELFIHSGEAYGGGTWRIWQRRTDPLPLTASVVQWLWQLRTGAFELTLDQEPPESTALGPWAEIETDANGVIRIEDLRAFNRSSVLLTGGGDLSSVPGLVHKWILSTGMSLEEIHISIDAAPPAAFGFDLIVDGSSILVPGTEPAFDAGSELVHTMAIPITSSLRAGTVLELHTTGTPSGAACFTLQMVA